MVKLMENPIKMDDLGYQYFWKHPYVKTPVGWWMLIYVDGGWLLQKSGCQILLGLEY